MKPFSIFVFVLFLIAFVIDVGNGVASILKLIGV